MIWHQIIDYAKSEQRPLVFITDDAKADWWHIVEGQTLGPRVELREEFIRETDGKWFHMYSMDQFLKHTQASPEVIEEAEGIKDQVAKSEQISMFDVLEEMHEDESEQVALESSAKCRYNKCQKPVWIISPFCRKHFNEHCQAMPKDQLEALLSTVEHVLKTLSYREREIIKLRHGLGDGYVYTLDECARIFKVTPRIIRAVQAKAERKLAHPVRAMQFEKFF